MCIKHLDITLVRNKLLLKYIINGISDLFLGSTVIIVFYII